MFPCAYFTCLADLLRGGAAGDYGFDPLRLGANPEALKWYQEAELYNGRWCMMATAGIIFTDLFGIANWWDSGTMVRPNFLHVLLPVGLVCWR